MRAKVIAGLVTFAALAAMLAAYLIFDARSADASDRDRGIVGAWYVDTIGAPFVPHGMIFHSDATVQLTNPDAAEATNSSSAGYGAWEIRRGVVVGQFLEVNADKTTNQFTSNLIVTFRVTVRGDRFEGPASASYYDGAGKLVNGPFPATLKGQRITVDSRPPVIVTQ